MIWRISRWVLALAVGPIAMWGQAPPATIASSANLRPRTDVQTTADWNRRLDELVRAASATSPPVTSTQDYRIGAEDLLGITVLDAPDLTGSVRVSASGEVSLPLLGVVKAAGLTPRELELVLQELLRRTYMKDPHVSVQVSEMQSHPVSVLGAVKQPGVFQVRGSKTLLEVLSTAGGLAEDAGETVIVMRAEEDGTGSSRQEGGTDSSSPGEQASSRSIEVNLKKLLESGDARYNVRIHPGDIVKVLQAGIVYVVGQVNRPGGFPLKINEKLTVLQAVALGEGLTPTAAKGDCRIIRTAEDGQRTEIPVNLAKILRGQTPDVPLEARDILFVPNSAGRSFGRGAIDAIVRAVSLRAVVFRTP